MASSADPWVREYNEASKLADDITDMLSERSSFGSGPVAQRHSSAIRRKITILGTRLDSLHSLLTKLPTKQPLVIDEEALEQALAAAVTCTIWLLQVLNVLVF